MTRWISTLACKCGALAKDEGFGGDWIPPDTYTCVECVRKLNQQAVRKNQDFPTCRQCGKTMYVAAYADLICSECRELQDAHD